MLPSPVQVNVYVVVWAGLMLSVPVELVLLVQPEGVPAAQPVTLVADQARVVVGWVAFSVEGVAVKVSVGVATATVT